MTLDFNLEEHIEQSDICNFYKGKHVLITGVTGYLGKFILEKLLRTCTGVTKIYILVRNKKGESYKVRMTQLLECPLFTRLHTQFEKKVIPIECDMESDDFGLSDNDKNQLQQNVNIVFHSAANVRFDQPLKSAFKTNIIGTKILMDFCETIKNLQAVVHVSTLYSFMHHDNLQEKFYFSGYKLEDVMNLLKVDDKTIQILQPKIMGHWVSTYSFTKAIIEDILNEKYQHLPLAIFRPAVVHAPSTDHPVAGYLDNLFDSLTAVSTLSNLGIIRTLFNKKGSTAHVVPADYTINALLTIPLDIHKNRYALPKIYHFSTSNDNCMDWEDLQSEIIKKGQVLGFENTTWYPSVCFTKSEYIFKTLKFLFHIFPAIIMDIISLSMGKKSQMVKKFRKVNTLVTLITWFTLVPKNFVVDNMTFLYENLSYADKQLFPFDMKTMNWDEYLTVAAHGQRKYLLKENDDTIPEIQEKFKRRVKIHYTIIYLFLAVVLYLFFSFAIFPYFSQIYFKISRY